MTLDGDAALAPARAAHLADASDLVATQRYDEAERAILRALEQTPRDAQALNLLALVRYKMGRLDDALGTYREITRLAPQDAGARRNLGLLALKLGRLDEAVPELEMAVRLVSTDERAWSYLGYAYAKRGEVVEAAAAFRRAGQDALAVELEHAAKLRRPPTPARRPTGDVAEVKAPLPVGGVEEMKGALPLAAADVRMAQTGPVALAPPLPTPSAGGAAARRDPRARPAGTAPAPAREGAATGGLEAKPVPLLTFVLSRLGQAAVPPRPVGALRLRVADEVHARADAILAGTGGVEWQPAHRRAQGRRLKEPLGDEPGRFFRLTGAGDVWIAGTTRRWMPVTLADDVFYVREDRVLAFDGAVSWEAGTVPGAAVRMLQFRGRGTVAFELDEAPIAVKVTEAQPTLLAAARLIGWVGRLVPHGAPQPLETGPFKLACQGEGVVLLDAGGK